MGKFKQSLFDRPTPRDVWRWYRAAAIGVAISIVILFGWAVWNNFTNGTGTDFISFWAAARLTIEGCAPLAYDIAAHRQLEMTVATFDGILSFPYPPPFVLFILPFGAAPYWLAFVLWVVATAAIYVIASRRTAPLPYVLAQPAVFLNAFIGQNGFLMTGLFMLGADRLSKAPFVAGAIWGLFVIKPQLALLFPVALIAGREWKVIAGGAASAVSLSLLALLSFGLDAYKGFLNILPFYVKWMSEGWWLWGKLASPFAFLRYFDVPQSTALAIHAVIAAAAALVTWRAWAQQMPQRVPILAAATLLIPPYTLNYDSLLLLVPMGWLIKDKQQPYILAAIWICCLLPVVAFGAPYPGPTTVPVAAILCLLALHGKQASPAGSAPAKILR